MLKYFFLVYSLLCPLLFVACARDNTYTEVATLHQKSQIHLLHSGYWKIKKGDSTSLGLPQGREDGGQTQLWVWNNYTHSIDLYIYPDSTKKYSVNVDLEKEKYGQISTFYVHNEDSIFILQENRLSVYGRKGMLKMFLINELSPNPDTMITYGSLNLGFSMYFDKQHQKLLLPQYCSGYAFYDKRYFRCPLEATMDTHTGDITPLPYTYSKIFQNGYYGFANQPYRTVNDSLDVVTFATDPNVYLYNRYSHTLTVKGGRSAYQVRLMQTVSLKYKNDSNFKIKHLNNEPMYGTITWDARNKLYHRVFLQGQKEQNSDGTFNTLGDRMLVIMTFDTNFNLITELDLGRHTYSYSGMFATTQGLFISKEHYKNKNRDKKYFVFDIFQPSY